MTAFFRKIPLDEEKNIPETRGDSDEKEQGGENVVRSEFPVYENTDEQTPEDGDGHADAEAAGIGQGEEPSSLLLSIHGRCGH